MIRLVTLLKRKPGTTHEQFLDHWLNIHGPLIANSSAANYVLRYEQHPSAWPPEGSGMPDCRIRSWLTNVFSSELTLSVGPATDVSGRASPSLPETRLPVMVS